MASNLVVRFKDPQPVGSPIDPLRSRIVIRGADRGSPGNMSIQDKSLQSQYGEAGLVTAAPSDFVTNGITITRIPYTFPDQATVKAASFSVKEEIARLVERGYIEVLIAGAIQTAAQIRAL